MEVAAFARIVHSVAQVDPGAYPEAAVVIVVAAALAAVVVAIVYICAFFCFSVEMMARRVQSPPPPRFWSAAGTETCQSLCRRLDCPAEPIHIPLMLHMHVRIALNTIAGLYLDSFPLCSLSAVGLVP